MSERRFFYHSFPRPKHGEEPETNLEQGTKILSFMAEAGLILAPEVVHWDASAVSGNSEEILILQRRACFTELSESELPGHSRIFGPISLAFDIADLRGAGALPVIYSPQGIKNSIVSQLSTILLRGAWHTEKALNQRASCRTPERGEFPLRRARVIARWVRQGRSLSRRHG
jgi:hypothetical protein